MNVKCFCLDKGRSLPHPLHQPLLRIRTKRQHHGVIGIRRCGLGFPRLAWLFVDLQFPRVIVPFGLCEFSQCIRQLGNLWVDEQALVRV